jgi:hypothetical protein
MVMDVRFKDIAILEGCGDSKSANYDGDFLAGFPRQAAVYRDNGTCAGVGIADGRGASGDRFPGRVERRDGRIVVEVRGGGTHAFELLSLEGRVLFSGGSPGDRTYEVTRPLPRGVYFAVLRKGGTSLRRAVAIP